MPFYRRGELMAYREGRYKIHLVTEGAYGMPPKRTIHQTPLLFDLLEDPGEQTDLADLKPEILKKLLIRVKEHQASIDVATPLFDQRLLSL